MLTRKQKYYDVTEHLETLLKLGLDKKIVELTIQI